MPFDYDRVSPNAHWLLQTGCGCLVAAIALVVGVPPSVVALALFGSLFGLTLFRGGRIVQRALEVSRARAERRLESAEARRGAMVSRTHDWLRKVQNELEALAASSDASPVAVNAAEASVELLEGLRGSLDSTRTSRRQFKGGRVPIVGGNAEAISKRLGGELKPYSWTPAHLMPGRFRGAATQTSMVIDEIRVLHNAEIERSVLLLTLVARAVLVLLAPLLGNWTRADTPVVATGPLANLVWLLAAVVSLGTMLAGPRVVDTAMSDGEEASRFRHRLLWIETPVALLALLLQPAWTVAIFASGWTNWWQRQTPGLAFDWGKLTIFVVAVVGLQASGLALQSVPAGAAAVEIVVALLAIAITGASYGAMLPLTVATAIGVVVGDSARSIRVARVARAELLSCSRQLAVAAATIDATAPEMPLARNAASMARKGAENLEREADLFGRRGALARQVFADLFDQAVAQSTLNRPDSRQHLVASQAAAAAGDLPPPYAMEPILGSLVLARVRRRRDAHVLQRFLVNALNEASTHGTEGVRILARRRDDRLLVTVGNLPRSQSAGAVSEGRSVLEHYASNLPGGRLTEPWGLRPPEAVESPLSLSWWVAEAECDITVIEIPLE